jgi:RimJ/RimL family protein N-acetyltransferase
MTLDLFRGERARLAAPDPEKDARVESAWTHDAEFQRLIEADPVRPLSAAQVKKKYEKLEKDENKEFYFIIRAGGESDDRALGFARLQWVDLQHGSALLSLGIAAPADRGQGYGADALRLVLRYAFDELGLHRLTVFTAEYNTGGLRFLQRHGFVEEVRRRKAIQRDGRRWDAIGLGLLRADYQ